MENKVDKIVQIEGMQVRVFCTSDNLWFVQLVNGKLANPFKGLKKEPGIDEIKTILNLKIRQ